MPRTKVAQTLRDIDEIGSKYGIAISNIFHAGDGNMHPILPFDPRKEGELERAQKAGDEILITAFPWAGPLPASMAWAWKKWRLMAHHFPTKRWT